MGRLATGIAGFDAMVGGGLPESSGVILQGPSGSEKLLFALTFLAEGLRTGGSGVLVIASQTAESILSDLRNRGVDLDVVAKENRLRIVDWYSWSEETVEGVEERGIILRSSVDLASLGAALSRAIAALPTGPSKRAVVEIFSPALQVYELTQVYAFAQSTKRKFDRFGFASFFIVEKDMHAASVLSTLAQPFDGVIEMERTRSGDHIVRKIGVLSLKDANPEPTFLPLEMTDKGFRVLGPPPSGAKAPSRSVLPSVASLLASQEEPKEGRQRRVELLMRIARERLAASPDDADACFTLAAGLASTGDTSGSLEALDRLVKIDPAYPGLWQLKAKLHAKLGDEEAWRQARMEADKYAEPTVTASAAPAVCPICASQLPRGVTVCPDCGTRVESEHILEELDELTKATIQDLAEGEIPEVPPKPEVTAAGSYAPEEEPEARPEPEPEKAVEAEATAETEPSPEFDVEKTLEELAELAEGPTAAQAPAIVRKSREARRKGLTNGLILGKAHGRRDRAAGAGQGRTNGLTNGLRGRTNGLTNGLRGRTNGLTNGLGRTNGLTNGLGRTNGLRNASGMAKFQRRITRSPWTRYGIPIAVIALLIVPLFLLWAPAGPANPIQIDGNFADWSGVAKMNAVVPASANPDIAITRVALTDNVDFLSFYLEVKGSILSGAPAPSRVTNGYFAFLDVDGSRATGYQVQGIGADRTIRIYTYGGQVVSSTAYSFDPNRGSNDWNAWVPTGNVQAAGSGNRMEFQIPWSDLSLSHGTVEAAFSSRSWDGQSAAADVVATSAGTYVVVSQATNAPTVVSGLSSTLSTFTFHAVGGDVAIRSINVTFQGTFGPSSLTVVDLVDESGTLLSEHTAGAEVQFELSAYTVPSGGNRSVLVRPKVGTADATTVGALIENLQDVVVTSGGVAFVAPARTPQSLAYVGTVPNVPVVDGGFSDWPSPAADPLGDVRPIWNPDVDLFAYAFQGYAASTYFTAQVVGTALNGTMIPASNPTYVPPSNATGNGTAAPPGPPPPPENGTDFVRLFLDADGASSTGYAIGGIGADYLVEIAGKEGLILSSQAKQFTGANQGQWSWAILGDAPTAKDRSRIEAALPGVAVTNASRAFYQTTGWGGSSDDSSSGVSPMRALSGPFLIQTLSLNSISTLTLPTLHSGIGSAAGDEYGFNVTGVGRINSNSGSYESFVIGAPYASSGAGKIYIFFGSAGWSPANINAASADVTITGQTAGDHFGWSVAAAGDVNGDGIMDFLVGAPDAGAGKAYLIYGRTDWTGVTGSTINTVASVVTITGQNSGDKFGSAVAGLGNVNNAGNGDFAVGAFAYASSLGRVYIFYDNTTMPTKASQASLFLDGTAASGKFGFSIAGAGNVNGDSYSDFVIGAPGASKAYVYTLGIDPVANGFLTANANGWAYGEVDPNGFDTGAWDNSGGSTPDSSGAGSFKFAFADTSTSLTLYFHAEMVTDNTLSAHALIRVGTDQANPASSVVTATGNGQHLIFGNWTTPALGVTAIPASTWTFSYDLQTGNGVTSAHADVHIYKLSSAGTLTAIDGTDGADATDGVAATNAITNPAMYTGTYSMPATTIAATDAIYIRAYGHVVTTKTGTKSVTFTYDATTASSTLVAAVASPELRYFHAETTSVNGVTDKGLLTAAPDQSSVQSVSFTASSAGHYLLGEWTFPAMDITSIPAGDWNFFYYATSQAADGRLDVHIYKLSAGGGWTTLDGTNGANNTVGVASTGKILASGTPGQMTGNVSLGSVSLATTDVIVVRVYVNIVTMGSGGNKVSQFYFDTAGDNSRIIYPGKTYTDRLAITSTSAFTSPPGTYTNIRYRVSYNATVTNIGDAFYKVRYDIRNSANASTVAYVYSSGPLTTTQSWSLQTGTFTGLAASTGYKIRVMLEVYNINQGQTPSITAYVDDIVLQFETVTTLTGTASTNFGWSVGMVAPGTGLTTFNNDTYADVIVGAPGTTNGQVTIYYGSASFSSTAAVTITGAASGDKFGYSVSTAADNTGDGIADIVIGAPYHANGAITATGAVYVFAGSSSPSGTMTTANAFDSAFGENANDHFGWSVSYSHPNGAARSFLLVGAPNYSAPNANEGKVYLIGIPEFSDVAVPIVSILFVVLSFRGLSRRRRRPATQDVPRH